MGEKVVPIKKERIEWLDGIKGWAALVIFALHWTLGFYPALMFGSEYLSHANGLETQLYYSPFRMFLEGRVMVIIFCLTSGMFTAMQIMNMSDVKGRLPGIVIKKYLRLMLPVVPLAVIVWAMMKLGLFTNVTASAMTGSEWLGKFYAQDYSLPQMLVSAVVTTWFYGDDIISTIFWMMKEMFYGSFLTIILSTLYWKYPKKSILIYIFTFVCFLPRHDFISVFVLAPIFVWLMKEGYVEFARKIDPSGRLSTFVGSICIIFAFFFGAYPEYVEPVAFYTRMNFNFKDIWFMISGFLFIYGIYNLKGIQKILAHKYLKKLGMICYSLVLVHIPVMFSFTSWLFMLMYNNGISYHISAFVSFIISIPITIAISYLFNKYIENGCGMITDRIIKFLEK